jgi:hypothetical protein
MKTFEGHSRDINRIDISADGVLLVSGSRDSTARSSPHSPSPMAMIIVTKTSIYEMAKPWPKAIDNEAAVLTWYQNKEDKRQSRNLAHHVSSPDIS